MGRKEDVVRELHKPARKRYKRRRVIVKGVRDLFQADLVEMIPFARVNKGFRYILVVIDTFTKFVWALPVKRKTAEDVTSAMKSILKQSVPAHLQTDNGKEFYNQAFRALMKEYGVNHYSTYSSVKASIVERVNRTLKNIMWKHFSMQKNNKWLDLLPKVVAKYNASTHGTTGFKPKDAHKHEKEILETAFTYPKVMVSSRFSVGDKVRISKAREVFTRGYTPNWSTEIFTIAKIRYTNPTTYLLEDSYGDEIQGGFYEEELQKVKHPDVFLVDKILKRKGNQVYVKFSGMNQRGWLLKKNAV